MASIFSSKGTMVYQRDNHTRVQVIPGKPVRVYVWRPDLRVDGWFKVPNRNWRMLVDQIKLEVRQ